MALLIMTRKGCPAPHSGLPRALLLYKLSSMESSRVRQRASPSVSTPVQVRLVKGRHEVSPTFWVREVLHHLFKSHELLALALSNSNPTLKRPQPRCEDEKSYLG